jgi:hypothetical protein
VILGKKQTGHKPPKHFLSKSKKRPEDRSAETQIYCYAPASGAVSGLSTLLLITVDHEFLKIREVVKLKPISRSRQSGDPI